MNKEKAKLLVVRKHWTQVGEERERERIIELLENQSSCSCETPVSHAIALIKGEPIDSLVADTSTRLCGK